jgi:hypothetical protein
MVHRFDELDDEAGAAARAAPEGTAEETAAECGAAVEVAGTYRPDAVDWYRDGGGVKGDPCGGPLWGCAKAGATGAGGT